MRKAFSICGLVFGLFLIWSQAVADFYVISGRNTKYAPVEKTGQTECYDTAGEEIDCTDTGLDGDLQKGVAWPNPRFTDNADGTVQDNLTGLIWLKNANCFGTRRWMFARSDCNGLSSGSCGLTDGSSAGDWHLPNLYELESLRDMAYFSPCVSNTAGTGQWTEGNPFSGVQNSYYWTSTTNAGMTGYAWSVSMDSGSMGNNGKNGLLPVWPVRGGSD